MARLSTTFKSIKSLSKSQILPSPSSSSSALESPTKNPWTVYLILSTNPPIKTYVGVTNNFSIRLKQHNGELKGGAKASRAGRPWICACLIQGFINKSKAYEFESKWKSFSRKLPRKKCRKDQEQVDDYQSFLLQHRYAALDKVKDLIDFSCLDINWHLDPM
ncbi:hypothetical protein CASFOL_004050 [Castilleja foliolosa]|uniref:GIY-YIG domain-containing protein n=1 Tax=Castilleja foliolosa TaxID=1961234 RepID=A0ABD3EMF6_9LAMI